MAVVHPLLDYALDFCATWGMGRGYATVPWVVGGCCGECYGMAHDMEWGDMVLVPVCVAGIVGKGYLLVDGTNEQVGVPRWGVAAVGRGAISDVTLWRVVSISSSVAVYASAVLQPARGIRDGCIYGEV